MSKINLGVIFGGQSTEYEVSTLSGMSVVENLNRKKYNVFPIFIDKQGVWYEYKSAQDEADELELSVKIYSKSKIKNIVTYLKELDVVFPVMHGKYGEDGAVQGMLEMLQIPYVGCGILASSIGMDKVYTKAILEKAEIKQARYCYVKVIKDNYILVEKDFTEINCSIKDISRKVKDELGFPVFVKPSNSGSSIGISKANNRKELEQAIIEAAKFDTKILIEENIDGHEIECAILKTDEIIASCTGEIVPAEDFYTFEAKYNNPKSVLKIPSQIECEAEIQKLAIKAFKAIDGKGLARVDFFVNEAGEIYLNEINTMPGFTSISMYPKLWEASGLNYTELLDKIVTNAF